MTNDDAHTLQQAMKGDIQAFQTLFSRFQPQLKSYLFRLTAHRADAEDLAHDTFIRAFDRLSTFQKQSSLKTWVFQIASRLAYDALRKRRRWSPDVMEQAKTLVQQHPELGHQLQQVAEQAPYEIREHLSTCFTCVTKNLPLLHQIALLLKDMYHFSVQELTMILEKTEGQVKYLLQSARKTLTEVFDHRCALVNKNGVCHQCSELNGWLNPKQQQQEANVKQQLQPSEGTRDVYQQRLALVQRIDPLTSQGHILQEALMDCNRMAMGEASLPELNQRRF